MYHQLVLSYHLLTGTDEVQDTPAVEVDESLFQELGDLEDEGEDS